MPLEQVWRLARVWYEGRSDENWTPRTPAAAEAILAGVGLTGDFWRLSAPSPG